METWVLALVCVALALGGAMIGAATVFAVIRYRRRKHLKHRDSCTGCASEKCLGSRIHTDRIVSEELASELTPTEKQVLHKIACYNGAISLTLRLPEPSLGIPLSPVALPNGSTKDARFSLSSADAFSMSLPTTTTTHIVAGEAVAPQTASDCDNGTTVDQRPISHRSINPPQLQAQEKQQQQQQPDESATDTHSHVSPNPQSHADEETTATTKEEEETNGQADSSSVGKASIRSFKSLQNKFTKVQRMTPRKSSSGSDAQGAVSWSSPVDDRSRKSMAFETIVASENRENSDSAGDDSSSSYDGSGCSPRDRPTPSVAESNPETISTGTPPGSPRTLASPCNSFDYVFIPPSPSISSLYGVSAMDTLAHAPSTLANPRSANLAKVIGSPGAMSGGQSASLFSPPPMAFHQKYFENHSPRSPIVRTSSSDKV